MLDAANHERAGPETTIDAANPSLIDAPRLPSSVQILPPPPPRDSINGITVLVIDGLRFNRDLIKSTLASQGVWAFYEASTVAIAKKHITDVDRIDLIILENDLEGETGLEFTRRIRMGETTFDPTIPVVMMSDNANHELVIEARNTGVHELVSRPFDIGTLVEHVQRPFFSPRNFIRAPGYVGPDRRGEHAMDIKDECFMDDTDAASVARNSDEDGVYVARDVGIESTLDKYQQEKDPTPRAQKLQKGFDCLRPIT